MSAMIAALALLVSAPDSPAKIGDRIDKAAFTDIRSLPRTLADFGPKDAYVLAFVNTSCPVAQRYLPTLQSLSVQYRDKNVQFLAVNSADEDSLIDAATQAVRYEVEFPFGKDFGGTLAKSLGVRRTPEVVLLDAKQVLRYRGRIDDRFRLGGNRPEARKTELKDALEAVLAGKAVEIPETEVDGCPISFPKARTPKEVNFTEHVAPILQKHCWQCHKEGGSAPFALTAPKQAAARAEGIGEVITDQRMPPWFAAHEFGPFVNRRGLSDEERDTIRDWVHGGAKPGPLEKLPPAPVPPKNPWLIGTPDLVIETTPQKIPATGDVPYMYAILPYVFFEDTWVQGVQILPDNARVLHHCNMAYGSLSEGFKESNFITGQVPGGEPVFLDPGVAVKIPKGSVLALQMHFVSTGKPETCTISVGLRFPRETVQRKLQNMQLSDTRFRIPPGAPAHKVAVTHTLPEDVIGVGLFAHMHLRGKDMSFIAHKPDGKDETLLIIANYNFGWQIPYRWEPGKKVIAKGTRLECIAHYDNSAFNPYNPDSKITVRVGPQTHHEMMNGFFFFTSAGEKLNLTIDPKSGRVVR